MPTKKPAELLEKYQAKRDFSKTAEPSGHEAPQTGAALTFCIQKHAASHLHYDFRLELDGVLKSWAVAKGPSFNPQEKRLAVEVEDHPLSYGGFEGIIPQGQYGGGTVMLWDRGTWEPLGDPHQGLEKGDLKFLLHGDKLQGKWVLVRMHPRPGDRHANWLLIKEKDEFIKPEGPSLPDNDDESVSSGRTMAQIAAQHDATWQSNRAPDDQPAAFKSHPKNTSPPQGGEGNVALGERSAAISGVGEGESLRLSAVSTPARTPTDDPLTLAALSAEAPSSASPLPHMGGERKVRFVEPELATLANEAPTGKEWLHEIKFDGYRLLAQITDIKPILYTRKGLDWTHKFPEIAASLQGLPAGTLLDGELVVLRPDGVSDFSLLQAHISDDVRQTLSYFAFDLLYAEGEDLREKPLLDRKKKLQALLAVAKPPLHYTDHVAGGGPAFFKQGCAAGLEGIICKPAAAPYRSGRVGDWLKVKCGQRQEFIICGFVPAENDGKAVGSLSMGFMDHGVLTYAGRVGTGFTHKSARELATRLLAIKTPKQPFPTRLARPITKDVIWVKPELVAEIAFANFTADKIIRHASFKGLREDKPAVEVVPEVPVEIKAAKPAPAKPALRTHSSAEMEVAGIRLTHPDKVLDDESHLTKLQLAEYYVNIADWVLPHIVGRPLSVVRCPDGSGKACFFQRHMALGLPQLGARGASRPWRYLSRHRRSGGADRVGAVRQPRAASLGRQGRHRRISRPHDHRSRSRSNRAVGRNRARRRFLCRDTLAELKPAILCEDHGWQGPPYRRAARWQAGLAGDQALSLANFADLLTRPGTGQVPGGNEQGEAAGQDLHRLFAQRALGDGGGALLHPRTARRASLGAARLGGTHTRHRSQILHHRNRAGAAGQTLKKDPWAELPKVKQGLKSPL